MTLTEFLLARIAETEARARGSLDTGYQPPAHSPDDHPEYIPDFYPEPTRQDRAEVAHILAECEAKRRIVALHGGFLAWSTANQLHCETCAKWYEADYDGPPNVDWPCATLRLLAMPYADHPDYREEWRP